MNPDSGCDQYISTTSGYIYLDLTNQEVVNFLADMTADIVRNYPGLTGFQYDDHFELPNEFPKVRYLVKFSDGAPLPLKLQLAFLSLALTWPSTINKILGRYP